MVNLKELANIKSVFALLVFEVSWKLNVASLFVSVKQQLKLANILNWRSGATLKRIFIFNDAHAHDKQEREKYKLN